MLTIVCCVVYNNVLSLWYNNLKQYIMKDLLRDALEEQILQDGINGDTTVLAELLNNIPAYIIYDSLSDEAQQLFNDIEFYDKPYMISTTDGHDIDYSYYTSEVELYETFEYMKGYESDIHLYKLTNNNEYEVIDSYWDGKES